MQQETHAKANKATETQRPSLTAHIPLFLFLLYVFIVMPLAINPALRAIGIFALPSPIVSVILSAVLNLLPLLVYLLFAKQRLREVLPPASLGRKNGLYITVISVAATLIIQFINFGHFNTLIGRIQPEPFELPTLGSMWIAIVAFGLLTATFEELWFRGPLSSVYRKQGVSRWKTALISGVAFGIVHAGVVQISYTALWGVLWAFMLYYTRSIWAPILAHVLSNILFNVFNPMYYLSSYADYWNILPTYVLIVGLAALVMVPIALICWKKLIANNPREKEMAAKETMPFTIGYWGLIAAMIVLAVRSML